MINAVPLPLKIMFTFKKVPRFHVKPGCPIAAASTHQHLHTKCAYMRSQACLQKNLYHSRAVCQSFILLPLRLRSCTQHRRAQITQMHTRLSTAEPVVNRSLQAFHFCSKSIGLCRTQHLIEAHKLTDYWIVTHCIGGCLWFHCDCFTKVADGKTSLAQLFKTFFLNCFNIPVVFLWHSFPITASSLLPSLKNLVKSLFS